MTFLLLVGVIFVVITQHSKLQAIERRLDLLEKTPEREPAPAPQSPEPVMSPSVPITGKTAENPAPFVAPAPNAFVEWLQKDFLMKMGALLLLMAFGWFVSYAFMNNWIGPAGRIVLGLLTGSFFLILGIWRMRTREHQGAVFTVLGSSTILLTVYAAREIYGFFTPLSALAIMFLSVLFVAYVSLRYKRQTLAIAGLVLASFAPHLTASPQPFVSEQFIYLLVVVIGTLWIVLYTEWRALTATALVIVFLETFPYLFTSDRFLVLLYAFMFVALFFTASIAGLLRAHEEKPNPVHLFIAFGTVAFLILWVSFVAPDELKSLLFVAWMLVFSIGAFVVFRVSENRAPFYVYSAGSIALLGAATAAELDGALLTIALALEIAGVVIVARYLNLTKEAVSALSLLFMIPMSLSLQSLVSPAWTDGVFHEDFFTILILALSLLITGVYVMERDAAVNEAPQGTTPVLFGGLYALALIWLVLHALLSSDAATFVALTIYTILGLAFFFSGKVTDKRERRIIGGMLIGAVVVRLLLIDVWMMELVGRIVTFVVIGALLISTAFMGKREEQTSVTHQS